MIETEQSRAKQAQPWVSFCLATYRRPERLRGALKAILRQDFVDFEVIVSDNDPQRSSGEVVAGLADRRLRYFANVENVGMVRNFNVALSHARGDYVVMITDDDPPYPTMLSKLRGLVEQYPGYGAYYGACEVLMENDDVAQTLGTTSGKLTFVSAARADSVRTYTPEEFLRGFFRRQIFRYMLWSTGIVERQIAVSIGGMPDYGSPFLTDFAYMALAGERKGFVALNAPLGYQAVHGQNSGFAQPHALRKALDGCHGYLAQRLSSRQDWEELCPIMENYLAVYIVGQIVAMQRHFHDRGRAAEGSPEAHESFESFSSIPYIRKLRLRYVGLLLLYRLPALQWLYRCVKKAQLGASKLWLRAS